LRNNNKEINSEINYMFLYDFVKTFGATHVHYIKLTRSKQYILIHKYTKHSH